MKRNLSFALCLAILLSIMTISPAMAKKEYDFLWAYHNGIAQFEKSKKIGLMNDAGEIILPAEYDEINPCFQNGYTWVLKDELYGLINTEGNVMIEPQFSYIDQMSSGLIAAQDATTGLFGYADVNGNWLIKPTYTLTQPFYGKLGIAYEGNETTIRTASGQEAYAQHALVFNPEGEIINDLGMVHWIGSHSAEPFNGVRVRDDMDYPNFARGDAFVFNFDALQPQTLAGIGFLDEEGQIVDCAKLNVDPFSIVSGMYHFSDSLLPVENSEYLWGYINRSGEIAIPLQYAYVLPFYQGKGYVTEKVGASAYKGNPYYYFIDTNGRNCGNEGVLGNQMYEPSLQFEELEISKTDRYRKPDYCWYKWLPADENVYIYSKKTKATQGSSISYNHVDKSIFLKKSDPGQLCAYFNTNTHEIIYENTFDVARTDFGCGLYKVADSKGRIGFIDENGNLVSGLKKKGQ